MRDNHEKLPEIVDAFEQQGQYFCLIRLERPSEQKSFRFSVSREGYLSLKRALELRPFDQMAGAQYRYFFVPSFQRLEGERVMMTVRVEQGRFGKEIATESIRDVVANLKWFWELTDWSKADYLAVAA